jgi:UDP-N-acetylmuramate dehydrogenase
MNSRTNLADALRAKLGDGLVHVDFPLGPLTTYRVGGSAAVHVMLPGPAELRSVLPILAVEPVPLLIVGRGSNLLVADEGFDGIALSLGVGFGDVSIEDTEVSAGGGALLPVVARQSVAAGLAGFEWAVGVPGSVGGAVRMNAGGHGSDMAAVVASVEICDLRGGCFREVDGAELEFDYRTSAVGPAEIVLKARLRLAVGEQSVGEAELAEIVKWRRDNQPGGQNAGSVFTNPVGDSAGRLIDAAGCKGLRIGSAEVSTKHANFIQVDAGGSADDVAALMRVIAERVLGHTGVALVAETKVIGFPANPDGGRST